MNRTKMCEHARRHLLESANVKRQSAEVCAAGIADAAQLIATCFNAGGKLLICGNGGSAADSQHLATEFVSTFTIDFKRPALPAMALTTDTSLLTASANDFGFEGVFARQVEAFGRPGDVLLGISTSGSSENVVRAMQKAKDLEMKVIALTSGEGGRLGEMSHVPISVPSTVTAHIQEAHIAIIHSICYLVERLLYVWISK